MQAHCFKIANSACVQHAQDLTGAYEPGLDYIISLVYGIEV